MRIRLVASVFPLALLTIALCAGGGPGLAAPQTPGAQSNYDAGLAWAAAAFDPSTRTDWAGELARARGEEASRTEAVMAEMRASLGPSAIARAGCYASERCEAILGIEALRPLFASKAAFQASLARIADLIAAVGVADQTLAGMAAKDARAGSARRLALSGARAQSARALYVITSGSLEFRDLDEPSRQLLALSLRLRTVAADLAATDSALAYVDAHGWPMASTGSGAEAADFWLILQHADRNPRLQLLALRQFGTAPDRLGPTERHDFAYLYDRVHVNAGLAQRYGTQLTCIAGRTAPRPTESAERLDELRASMGLMPMAEYLKLAGASC